MINKKNLWFLTLFSLVLVLSVYYITMPKELLLANNDSPVEDNIEIKELSIIETLKQEDNNTTLTEINKLKATISDNTKSTEDKNKAFDALKLLNQVSSEEELLEEKVKTTLDLDSFIKIEGDQIRVVVNSNEPTNTIANDIMRLIQADFDTKKYISVQFKQINYPHAFLLSTYDIMNNKKDRYREVRVL